MTEGRGVKLFDIVFLALGILSFPSDHVTTFCSIVTGCVTAKNHDNDVGYCVTLAHIKYILVLRNDLFGTATRAVYLVLVKMAGLYDSEFGLAGFISK